MEWKKRTTLLLGEAAMKKLEQAHILVVGLGGVGGYAVESLVRTGIGHLTLIDYDTIDPTNLNRQLIALTSTIGKKKTELWWERIKEINPLCNVTLIEQKLTKEAIGSLTSFDYVIDACDTLEVKEELIRVCHHRNIPLLTVTGTALKMDPSSLEIVDLSKTSYDPLAKRLRKMAKEEGIKGVMVVASKEIVRPKAGAELPSSIFVPAAAGILCANYVVRKLIGEIK